MSLFNKLGLRNNTRVYVNNNIDDDNSVEIVTDGELSLRLPNTITPPTFDYPIGAYFEQGIKVYPKEIDQVTLTYVRKPLKPFRNYTITANDDYRPIGIASAEQLTFFVKYETETVL